METQALEAAELELSPYASELYKELARGPESRLDEIFARTEPPSVESMLDWEYRGYNHSPRAVDLIRLRKFTKGLFVGDDGDVYGYNTPNVQNGLDGPWVAKPSDDDPTRFRFYKVLERADAVILDYSRGRNPRLAIYRGLRNYLVRVEPGSDEIVLGKAYFGVGERRFHVNYFLMERHRKVETAARIRARYPA